jgi:restriction system protein
MIESLKELGGSGQSNEVVDLITEKLNISEEEMNEVTSSGQSRIANQIHWARYYLVKSDFLDSSKRGVWALTEKGLNANLTEKEVLKLFKGVQAEFGSKDEKPTKKPKEEIEEEPPLPVIEKVDSRTILMNILQKLPSEGFERLCQRLLREAGFQKVIVTGKTGDGGIDGHGILQVNPFVSFQVLFQSKRYVGSVTVSQVRDFRGAMMGRTDKGIIITTGTFTSDAKREAEREGVPPIELVDGEKLLDMFEYLELGLKPKTVYEVDESFFDDYSK